MIKVFISYSHDSQFHRDFVRGIADRLRNEGIDCQIDQYVNGCPHEGWQRWMENQIETADFVLLVCTKTYLLRYRGLETDGGKGITFEGVVISQNLYDNYYRNTKFVPVLPDGGDFEHVPLPLKAYSTYTLPRQHDNLYRYLTEQPKYPAPAVGTKRLMSSASRQNSIPCIHSDRLPTVKGSFLGREAELKVLDAAWQEDNSAHIIQLVAPGGTGKTKLLRHWLDRTNDIDALIAWSFYSQGASEDKQASASRFFSHVFKKLGANRAHFDNDEDKGEYLADLLCELRCVLVLDGLEPMQYADKANRGELKDLALRALLKSLAGRNKGLCIITTRIAVYELSDRKSSCVISHNLENLSPTDGIKLLQFLGVQGPPAELYKTVEEYGRHALSLNLLGNVLRLRYQGDVHKRNALKVLIKPTGNKESQHAFKVMQAYTKWFTGEPELDLLRLLGLFDHPIGQEELRVLREAQIPNLTEGIEEDDWLEAIAGLREEHHLLWQHGESNDLDCHPLIREYFGKQLKDQQPKAWQQAHETLHHYYRTLSEIKPHDTLNEIQPLPSPSCATGQTRNIKPSVLILAGLSLSDWLLRLRESMEPKLKSWKSAVSTTCALNQPKLETNTIGAAFTLATVMGSIVISGALLTPYEARKVIERLHERIIMEKEYRELSRINYRANKTPSPKVVFLRTLLSRAAQHRYNHNFTLAHHDLQKVYSIAKPSGMRLYLTDYHLEIARLLLLEKSNRQKVQNHIETAAKLIKETGYDLRLPELQALQNID